MDSNKKNFIIQNFYNYIKISLDFMDTYNKNNKNMTHWEKKNKNDLILYNNNEIILKTKYQIIGIFNRDIELFSWGWGISNIDDNLLFFSKQMLNYGLKLSQENIIMKYLLTNSEIQCNNLLFEDYITAVVTYLLKKKLLTILFNSENLSKITLICTE